MGQDVSYHLLIEEHKFKVMSTVACPHDIRVECGFRIRKLCRDEKGKGCK